ncbi:MAG: HAD-IIIA family hydrolase [Pseudomonadales bacterium]|nr:HAD-IIIA family hydrolase [Pseudomonadales bacterium]
MKANPSIDQADQLAAGIKLLLLDVDGVLTDGCLYFSSNGEELKAFNTQDGHGIRMLMGSGVQVGIITGRESPAVARRAKDLGLEIVFQNQSNKLEALDRILSSQNLDPHQVAYAGDDLPDMPVMKAVGLSFAVANAHESIRDIASFTTTFPGGGGAVREICDYLLKSQGKYAAFIS